MRFETSCPERLFPKIEALVHDSVFFVAKPPRPAFGTERFKAQACDRAPNEAESEPLAHRGGERMRISPETEGVASFQMLHICVRATCLLFFTLGDSKDHDAAIASQVVRHRIFPNPQQSPTSRPIPANLIAACLLHRPSLNGVAYCQST